eukprot:m.472938 g.472938  ORF g.472938 m.472938 type:complete len:441 (+) comp33527_c0_seq1:134-1456(+)
MLTVLSQTGRGTQEAIRASDASELHLIIPSVSTPRGLALTLAVLCPTRPLDAPLDSSPTPPIGGGRWGGGPWAAQHIKETAGLLTLLLGCRPRRHLAQRLHQLRVVGVHPATDVHVLGYVGHRPESVLAAVAVDLPLEEAGVDQGVPNRRLIPHDPAVGGVRGKAAEAPDCVGLGAVVPLALELCVHEQRIDHPLVTQHALCGRRVGLSKHSERPHGVFATLLVEVVIGELCGLSEGLGDPSQPPDRRLDRVALRKVAQRPDGGAPQAPVARGLELGGAKQGVADCEVGPELRDQRLARRKVEQHRHRGLGVPTGDGPGCGLEQNRAAVGVRPHQRLERGCERECDAHFERVLPHQSVRRPGCPCCFEHRPPNLVVIPHVVGDVVRGGEVEEDPHGVGPALLAGLAVRARPLHQRLPHLSVLPDLQPKRRAAREIPKRPH